MFKQHIALISGLFLSAALPALAYAEIGEVGSPVVPSNAPTDASDPNSNFGAIGSPVVPSNAPKDLTDPNANFGAIGSPVVPSNEPIMPINNEYVQQPAQDAASQAGTAAQQAAGAAVAAQGAAAQANTAANAAQNATTPQAAQDAAALGAAAAAQGQAAAAQGSAAAAQGQAAAVQGANAAADANAASAPTTTGLYGIAASPQGLVSNSPMQQPAAPQAAVNVQPPEPQTALPDKPLMVVRFNQPHVYYGHALDEAVNSAEHSKPGAVTYNLVSYVPAGNGSTQSSHINDMAQANLASMIQEIQNQGVPASHITTTVRPATDGMQHIEMFVQ